MGPLYMPEQHNKATWLMRTFGSAKDCIAENGVKRVGAAYDFWRSGFKATRHSIRHSACSRGLPLVAGPDHLEKHAFLSRRDDVVESVMCYGSHRSTAINGSDMDLFISNEWMIITLELETERGVRCRWRVDDLVSE